MIKILRQFHIGKKDMFTIERITRQTRENNGIWIEYGLDSNKSYKVVKRIRLKVGRFTDEVEI